MTDERIKMYKHTRIFYGDASIRQLAESNLHTIRNAN